MNLDKLWKLFDEATPGPWVYDHNMFINTPGVSFDVFSKEGNQDNDAKFIAWCGTNRKLLKDIILAARALAERHKWHPDLGECICTEHRTIKTTLSVLDNLE